MNPEFGGHLTTGQKLLRFAHAIFLACASQSVKR